MSDNQVIMAEGSNVRPLARPTDPGNRHETPGGTTTTLAQGPETTAMSDAEWAVRCDLAASFRASAMFGWEDLLSTHSAARIPGTTDFLINPFGLMFEEITASNLLRYTADGQIVGNPTDRASEAAVAIQMTVLKARPDVNCAVHLHTRDGIAVSTLKEGLLPAFQRAALLATDLAYHKHEGGSSIEDLQAGNSKLAADLGDRNLVILRNHGTLAVGSSVGEAYMRMFQLERACAIQTTMLGMGRELEFPGQEEMDSMIELAGGNVLAGCGNEVAWAALRRKLDRICPEYAT